MSPVRGAWKTTPAGKLRARGLGLAFPGVPGPFNVITDVAGVEVGYTTLISGDGPLTVGHGPVRTGVTAILPRGRDGGAVPCMAGSFSFNGNGEMTGLAWIEEAGELQTPITITNTHSCGVTRDATLQWMLARKAGTGQDWGLPVAAETYDGDLNDINGFHVTAAHTVEALEAGRSGAIELGNVGGGTGMSTFDFKGGSGSASRLVTIEDRSFSLGVFVQSNFGKREDFTLFGVPVGQHIREGQLRGREQGSIIAIIATDAPLMPHQLKRLARRVPVALARLGGIGYNSSGDIFLAFSTANTEALGSPAQLRRMESMSVAAVDPLLQATVHATEEAIVDAMICAETMVGRDGNTCMALPHDRLMALLRPST